MEKLKAFIKKHKVRLILILTFVAIYYGVKAFYNFAYPTITWQQKLTVEINTPNGLKSGYGVYEVKNEFYPDPIFKSSPSTSYQGYAAIVALDRAKYLFITQESPRIRAEASFEEKSKLDAVKMGRTSSNSLRLKPFFKKIVKHKPSRPVDMSDEYNERSIYGIYFPNMNDPISAVKVDLQNMKEVFGEGYSLKSVQLSIVKDALDFSHIEKILPWVTQEKYNENVNLAGEDDHRVTGSFAHQFYFRHFYRKNSDK